MKRRNLLLGLGGLAGAVGAVGTGAFSSITANRDVTVSVADDTDAYLALRPSGGANSAYVKDVSKNNGLLALDFADTEAGGTGLGTDSIYTFDNVFTITNQGTQPVYVWGTFDGGSESFTAGGEDTDIWLYPDGDSETKLRDNGDGIKRLGVGKTVHIGVYVDTHDVTSDQTQTLAMTIHADAEKPAGAPGTTKPYPPIDVSKDGEQTRYFHSIPTAFEYASGGEGVVIGVEEGTYPRDINAIRVTDPENPRNWTEYELSLDDNVSFTNNQNSDYSIEIQQSGFGFTSEPWLVTVLEDQGSTDTTVQLGLSELFDSTVTTVGKNGLTFEKDGQKISISGNDTFVFSRPGQTNQTLSLTASTDGSDDGLEQVILTTADASLSFTDRATLRTAPELIAPRKRDVSVRVPDSIEIKGRDGRPTIEHAITVNTESTQEALRFQNLVFGKPLEENTNDEDIQQSVAITSLNDGAVSNLFLSDITFEPIISRDDGLRVEPSVSAVNGLKIENCEFSGRLAGLQVAGAPSQDPPAQITQLRVTGSTFRDSEYGMNVANIREGFIDDTEFVNNGMGINMDSPTAFGLDDVTFKGHDETAFEYGGNLTSVSEPPELSDQIESDVGDGNLGVSGIVKSTFDANDADVKISGNYYTDNYPVEDCTFSSTSSNNDIRDYTQ